jgi:ABC-type amino acid transport system permease subunit
VSDRNLLRERELERRRTEIVTSHYVAAAVLLAAAAGFLVFILALSRVFDFDRFAY